MAPLLSLFIMKINGLTGDEYNDNDCVKKIEKRSVGIDE